MLSKWIVSLAVVALALVVPVPVFSKDAGSSAAVQKDDLVRNALMGLQAAITQKDADKASALFADNATFIDQKGEEVRGRAEIRVRFLELFKSSASPSIGIHPQNISFPAANVALAVGEVSRKQESSDLPVSRFTMVLVEKSSTWLINQLTETAMQTDQPVDHLQGLSWLIGHWTADTPNATAKLDIEWMPNNKFILSKCTLEPTAALPQIDTQMIGWDPRQNAIVSWHFDDQGGFGTGTWKKQPNENKWIVDVSGVGADGSKTDAANVFAVNNADEFVWQSIRRFLNGTAVADTQPVTVNRVTP